MKFDSPSEQLFFTTVRIETTTANGAGTGTGFGIIYEHHQSQQFPFIVTNKHVIKGAIAGRFFFTREKDNAPLLGQRIDVDFDDFEQRWHGHPDPDIDVAIMPYFPVVKQLSDLGHSIFFKPFHHMMIPSEDQLRELDALEEIAFVGYPNGIFDTTNLLPILRRGSTATPPQVNYDGKPIFLVDASVFPGSSGSPVLIFNSGGFSTKHGFVVGTRVILLGIISSVLIQRDNNLLEFVTIPTANVPFVQTVQMIDLGIVYKSSTIIETIKDYLKMHNVPLV